MLKPNSNFNGISVSFVTNYDCNLACKYDLAKGTKVLMSDFTYKNIEDVKIGDKIIAFDEFPVKYVEDNSMGYYGREFKVAEVLDSQMTRELTEAYKYTFIDGDKEITVFASGEHPILNVNSELLSGKAYITTEDCYKAFSEGKELKAVFCEYNPFSVHEYNNNEKHTKIDFVYSKIVNVEKLEKVKFDAPVKFYNLTTSAATFIAENLLVHNCYEINKRHVVMPIEYAKKMVDLILDDPDPIGVTGTEDEWMLNSGVIMDFIGGDSFMHPDIIDDILTYFVQQCVIKNHRFLNNWRASISSNGTLFSNKPVRDLIEKWKDNMSIGVSIDGCPEIHDKNRIMAARDEKGNEVGSMKYILEWWPWVKKNLIYTGDQTKATCSKDSIPYLFESLRFMHEVMGMSNINQNFIMEATGCTDEDYAMLDEQLEKCKNYLLEHRNELYWSMFDKAGSEPRSNSYKAHGEAIKKGWCGSGAMPSLGIDGKIYPCFRWVPHTMQGYEDQVSNWNVGDVWNGFNHKERFRKVKTATRESISSRYCLNCEVEGACAYCVAGCYSEFNKFKRTEHICTITKLRMKWARIYWNELEELEHNQGNFYSTVLDSDGKIRLEVSKRIDEIKTK